MRRGAVYHGHKPVRFVLKLIGWIVLVAVVLAIFMFFWFRRYIVYTDDGLRVQVPYLDETMTD
jgi:hypothetical protein